MLVSIEWLRSLLPELDLSSPTTLADQLTALGLEVEGISSLAEALNGVVVGYVRSAESHPKADRLRVTSVFDGTSEHTVVCGAPNVAAGQKVAFATLGTTLPNGLTMEPRKIRGVASQGMLCSNDELGLAGDTSGILILPETAEAGKPLAEVLGRTDVVLELGITPNRPDALSHLGVARDIAALNGASLPKIVSPVVETNSAETASSIRVEIEDKEGCHRYAARVIKDIKLGPSPAWVQDRLRALNQRPISNVVDATNIVLLEMGQPLHAFDRQRLHGDTITVRRAHAGEPLELLDGRNIKLHPEDLVIADKERPVALAGVMGGANSEVQFGDESQPITTEVLLESAYFHPSCVRRTAKRYGLHTEASHRFERGVDPAAIEAALDRCADLIREWSGGTVLKGRVVTEVKPFEAPSIPIRAKRASMLLGRPVSEEEVTGSLTRLGLSSIDTPPSPQLKGASWFQSPSWRVDLNIEADLIEEVGRLAGYDQIEAKVPSSAAQSTLSSAPKVEAQVRDMLIGDGFLETISLSFASPEKSKWFCPEGSTPVRLVNPLGEETSQMRPSLLPALLDAARHNQTQLPSITDLRLFEIGVTFGWLTSETLPQEEQWVSGVIRGRQRPKGWSSDSTQLDVYDLKAVVERLCDGFRIEPQYEVYDCPYLHPRSATRMTQQGQVLGHIGELHPDVAESFGLEGPPVFIFELSLNQLSHHRGAEPKHRPLPKQPPAQRDLSFFVGLDVSAANVVDAVHRARVENLESVNIFDVYEGKGVPKGMKSIAFELTFRASDRTLSDKEIDQAQAQIVESLASKVGAQIRDS